MASEEAVAQPRANYAPASATVAVAGLLALGLALQRPSSGALVLRLLILCGLMVVIGRRVRGGERRLSWDHVVDPWMLTWIGATGLSLTMLTDDTSGPARAAVALLAAGLAAMGTGMVVWDRMRRVAPQLLAETAIGVATVALAVWVLTVEPSTPSDAVLEVTLTFVAAVVSAATIRVAASLVSAAKGPDRVSVVLLAVAVAALSGACVVTLLEQLGHEASERIVAGVALSCVTASTVGMVHPSNVLLLAPAVIVGPRIDLPRVAMALGGVLVGPALVGIGLSTELDISVATAVSGGAALSLVVAAYVLRMVRSWGQLEHAVHHDPLTGLPNRTLFYERLDLAIARSRRERRTIALMFLDLDRFKNVNDSLGHEAGNDLLRAVASRLGEVIKGDATVARLGGDEFAILLPRVQSFSHSEAVARQVLKRFSEPFNLGRRRLYVTPSIGVAHFPQDAMEATALLEAADAAMYRAKERGRNTVELYTHTTRASAMNKLDIESALHDAMVTDQLRLLYQPKLRLTTGEITGVEALVRWNHPELGPIPPDQFIPVAEESGLIEAIGEWVLYQACGQVVIWDAKGLPRIDVSVNLSPRQFQLSKVSDLVARVLRATNLSPRRLELEVTENLALQDPQAVSKALEEMRAIGVRFAIDDFGVGYSGLEYLERFRFDTIKIDRKFLQGIERNGGPIVKAVIAMAKGLNLEVVAEGVETRAQLDFLRRYGCDQVQGFLLSGPVDAAAIEDLLVRYARRIAATRRTTQPQH